MTLLTCLFRTVAGHKMRLEKYFSEYFEGQVGYLEALGGVCVCAP